MPAVLQGPTKDNRIKPDIVAPGTLYSAKRLTSVASDQCGVMGMAVGAWVNTVWVVGCTTCSTLVHSNTATVQE